MKQIPLTQNKVALVDDDTYEAIGSLKWYALKDKQRWYAGRAVGSGIRAIMRMHHCIVGQPLNNDEVDHIDGDGLNNQRSNLRIVSKRLNQGNQINRINPKSSKYVGVSFRKATGRWEAGLKINNKRKHLGYFFSEQEAHEAYLNALSNLNENK
jgi:hypothetical protein